MRSGGSNGNEQLTAILATLLLVLLAVEGATLLSIRSLLTVHAFVGMLLVPPIALKLASTSWRMARYYLGGAEYVRRGPPHPFLRVVVAPVVVVSTTVLFATGIALLVLGQTQGTLAGLHKAAFVVWFGAMSLHVLTRAFKVLPALRLRLPGTAFRVAVVSSALVAGVCVATLTLPAADALQDNVTAVVGVDVR